ICCVELAAQSVELSLVVEREPDGRLRRRAEQRFARVLYLVEGLGPLPAHHHDLRAVRTALAAERHEIRLRVAPAAEGLRPLAGSAQIEAFVARLDHRAVDDARN